MFVCEQLVCINEQKRGEINGYEINCNAYSLIEVELMCNLSSVIRVKQRERQTEYLGRN